MQSIITALFVTLATAGTAHAQWIEDCRDGETYEHNWQSYNDRDWDDEWAEVYEYVQSAPIELRLGTTTLYLVRQPIAGDNKVNPAGVPVDTFDTIAFGDTFFSDAYKGLRQRVVNHELAHVWAFR